MDGCHVWTLPGHACNRLSSLALNALLEVSASVNSAYRQYTGYRAYPLGLPVYRLAATATAGEPVLPSGTYNKKLMTSRGSSSAPA